MMTPKILYGTAWKEDATQKCVGEALAAGFRGIDTANQRKHYHEAGVGEAVKAAGIPRSELFLQTKFTFQRGQDHRLPYDPKASISNQVKQSFESSLEHLNSEYIDSLVLHGPSVFNGTDLTADDWEAWKAMEELQREGKARVLGVSNVNLSQLRDLYENSKIKPSFAQIRCYAKNSWDSEIRNFCLTKDIVYQGFSLLTANAAALNGPQMRSIADKYDSSVAQVIFAFARQIGMLPLTGTTDSVHMKQDLESLSLVLEQADMNTIENIERI
ncbi:MAG: aldo/keto reductase [Bdellovibrionaceae bacterium]|nr:aldo/keto reductase [Pseudobdellovibrionaceae bacterium]